MNFQIRSALRVLMLLVACQLCLAVQASDEKPPKELSAVTVNWEPFYADSLPDEGLVSDIVRASFAQSGHAVNIDFIPWDRALDMSAKGKSDFLMGLWYGEERAQVYHYSEPFLANRLVFVKAKDNAFEYDGLSSLHGKQVGTIRKYAYLQEFLDDPEIEKIPVSTLAANLKKVAKGRIELTLDDEIVIKDLLNRELPELKSRLTFSQNALEEKSLYIASSRQHPQGEAIIQAFNRGLKIIQANGEYDALLQKHGFQ